MTDVARGGHHFPLPATNFAGCLHALHKAHLMLDGLDLDTRPTTASAGLDVAGVVGAGTPAVMAQNLTLLNNAEVGAVVKVFECGLDVDGDVRKLDALVLLVALLLSACVEVEAAAAAAKLLEEHVEGIATTTEGVLLTTIFVPELIVVFAFFTVAQNFIRYICWKNVLFFFVYKKMSH